MSAFEVVDKYKTEYTLIPFSKVDRVSMYKSGRGGYELLIKSQGETFTIRETNNISLYNDYRDWLGRN